MLSAEENDILCRVGPGTPMGNLMRRYWVPALLSRELVADGEPVRLMLLGEKLIAFRDTQGRVGIMDHECPHRLASLFYGRNEEGGIRCIYHGWKFDVEGNCLDMANVPPHQDFKANVKAPAYKVVERNGLVWTYMGQGDAPPLPMIPANLLPEDGVTFQVNQADCNWFQTLEGDIDTSHTGFLHGGFRKESDFSPDNPRRLTFSNRTPEYEVTETEWGVMYGALRPSDAQTTYWRVGHFMFPFWAMAGASPFNIRTGVTARVPMDDYHTMSFTLRINANRDDLLRERQQPKEPQPDPETMYLPNTTDWFGRWRLSVNVANDHNIDRAMQKTILYSGIRGTMQQDQAVQETMGPIENRTKEHLAISDRMIMTTRRALIDAAIRLRDQGIAPPNVNRPEIYFKAESGYFLAPREQGLEAAYQDAFRQLQVLRPQTIPAAAE